MLDSKWLVFGKFSLNFMHLLHQRWTLSSALKQNTSTSSFRDTSNQPYVELLAHFQQCVGRGACIAEQSSCNCRQSWTWDVFTLKDQGWRNTYFLKEQNQTLNPKSLNIMMSKKSFCNVLMPDSFLSMPGAASTESVILSIMLGRDFQ